MASINEAFVGDDDVKETKDQHEHQITSSSPPLKALEDIFSTEIDYSVSRKAPLFIATAAGMSSFDFWIAPQSY